MLEPRSPTGVSIQQKLDRIRALPSVQTAAAATDVPLSGIGDAIFYTAEGQPPVTAQEQAPRLHPSRHAELLRGAPHQAGRRPDIFGG